MKRYYLIILLFLVVPISKIHGSEVLPCDPGSLLYEAYADELPTYSYGDDGLVQFHIQVKAPGGYGNLAITFNHYNSNCGFLGYTGHNYGSETSVLPGTKHLTVKAVENSPGFFNFIAYDEQTGESLHIGPTPPDFNGQTDPVIAVKFSTSDGYPGYPGYVEHGVLTPAVPVKNSNFIKTPVLFIPGVTGTELIKENQKIWPNISNILKSNDRFMDILAFDNSLKPVDDKVLADGVIKKEVIYDYTDSLLKEFENQGYVENKSVFTFPYDWRYGVSDDTVNNLKQKIEDIMAQTGSSKINVIAHSTGGLLVKKYVMQNSDHHIGKAMFVGVPNTGAPKAIKVLLMGDNFGVPGLNDEEMKYISENLPVVYDLSPSEKYYSNKGSYMRTVTQDGFFSSKINDLSFNEANDLLINTHKLNNQALENAHALHALEYDNLDLRDKGVDLYSVVGCKSGTIGKIVETVNSASMEPLYQIREVLGDGTVPLESATNLPIDQSHKYFALKADHGKMPSQDGIRQLLVNVMTNSTLDVGSSITQDMDKCKLKGRAVSIYSPMSIEVIDQGSNRSGVAADGSVQNDIPSADYQLLGERKFVFLPNDDGQTYTINLAGTGTGDVTIKIGDLDGTVNQTEVFADLPVATTTQAQLVFGNPSLLKIDFDGDGVFEKSLEPDYVLTGDEDLDAALPSTTAAVAGTKDASGNYIGQAEVTLTAADAVVTGFEQETSGILKTKYRLGSNSSYTTYASPLVLNSPGDYTISYYSIDRAGNKELPKALTLSVVASPETKSEPPSSVPSSGGSTVVAGTGKESNGTSTNTPILGKVLGVSIESPHAPGTLVLDTDGHTIYLIGKGKKYGFRRPDEYFSYGLKFSDAVPGNTADHILPDSDIIYAKPGTFIRKGDLVYIVTDNKVMRLFDSKEVAEHFGYQPGKDIAMDTGDYSQSGMTIKKDDAIPVNFTLNNLWQ